MTQLCGVWLRQACHFSVGRSVLSFGPALDYVEWSYEINKMGITFCRRNELPIENMKNTVNEIENWNKNIENNFISKKAIMRP